MKPLKPLFIEIIKVNLHEERLKVMQKMVLDFRESIMKLDAKVK